MFRRSRFSVRPNVSSLGRAGGPATTSTKTSAESASASTEVGEAPKEASDNRPAETVTEEKPDVPPSEQAAVSGNSNDQNGEGSASSATVQRRKRFSVKPRVAPGRPAPLPRTPKSPIKAAPESPAEVSVSSLDKSPPTTSRQTGSTASVQGLLSPRRQRPSEGCKPPRFQPRPAVISSESITKESPVKTSPSADKSKQAETPSCSQIKDAPLVRGPDKIPLSLPDREAAEISEKARTLVKSKTALSLTPSAYSLSRLLNTPSDLQRLVKAQKLRELLKEERRKETTRKRAKSHAKEYSLDPSKMTMRDLIHYLPTSNPMMTCLEDSSQENETVLPASPEPQTPTEEVKEPEVAPKVLSVDDPEEADEEEEEDDDDALMVPQVKVAEDGSLIIDEESLTVEVQRAKGPNVVAERDPIFERGSTTTYSSFRKGSYTRPWFSEETDMFFLAVSMVGTDFTMICQLFPHRARSEIKNKFKKEERENSWRVDKAFKERRKLDIEYFSKLLEKIMDYQKNKKKLKSLEKANAPKKSRKKAKASGKKSAKRLSDVEEEDDEEEEEILDLEDEVEKENEDVCNEGGASKRKKKRKKLTEEGTEEPSVKKIKTAERTGDDGVPHDAEAALPEDHTSADICEKPTEDSISKGTLIKPAQLSRGRVPKPLLPLGRKYAKKPPKVEGNSSDAVSKVQENKDASPSGQAKVSEAVSDDTSSEEEEIVVKPPKPTRYGRVPKPTKPLIIEDTDSSASETPLASQVGSPPSSPNTKTSAKKRESTNLLPSKASKKPKLITLTASQSDFSDEEALEQQQLAYSNDSVFMPASSHMPQPVIPDVDETMAEFDILASMPDVLGISHDTLCPDSSCAQAQQETGSAEPFEHQLDLLVDVIDYLSSETTEEVSKDQSSNEAAKTLLTIGNVGQTSQSEEHQTAFQDRSQRISLTSDKEDINTHSAAQEENSLDMFPAFDHELTELSTTTSLLEPATTNMTDHVILNTSDEICEQPEAPTPKLQTVLESPSKGSPQTKKQRMPKLKPKPNIGRSSKAPQSKPNSEESAVEMVSLSIDEDTGPKTLDTFKDTLKHDFSGTQTQLQKTPPDSEERFVHEMDLRAAKSDQASSELIKESFSESYCEPEKDVSNGNKSVMIYSKNDNISSLVEGVQTAIIAEREIEKESNRKRNIVFESTSNKDAMSPSRESLPITQNEMKDTATSSQSEEDKIKPKPSLPPISGRGNYESKSPERPVDHVSAPVQAGQEPSPVLSSSLEDATVIQKDVETPLTPQPRRSRLQKPKPNLPHISRSLRSKPATKKICEEHNISTEESFVDAASTSDFTNKTTKDCVQTESGGFITETVDLTGADSGSNSGSAQLLEGRDISSSHVGNVEHLLIHQNEGEVEVASQLKKSGLQKPKPIRPQKADTSNSKPETNVESAERDVIAEESIGGTETTSQFTDELTSSISTDSSFTNVDISIVTELPVGQKSDNNFVQVQTDQDNVLTTLVGDSSVSQNVVEPFSRKIRLQKPKPNLSHKSRASQSIPGTTTEPEEKVSTTKESLGVRKPTLDFTNENLSACAHSDSSCGILKKKDSAGTGPPVKQGGNIDLESFQMQEGQTSISCFEELQAMQKEGEVASTSQQRRSRLQKPKPNLPQSLKTRRSKHEITKLPVEKDLIPKEEIKNTEPPFTLIDENLTSPSETESGFSDAAKKDLLVSELQVGQCLNNHLEQVQTNLVSHPETTQEAEAKCFSLEELTTNALSFQFTDETVISPVKTTVTRTESAVKELLCEQKLNVELAEVCLGEGHGLTMSATNAEASPAQSERTLTCQPLRGRVLKPKPHLPLILRRSKSEKKPDPMSNAECEVIEPTLAVDSEHQHSYPTSGPPTDLHSTPAHSKEMTATAETKTSPKLTEQMVLVAVPSGQSVPAKIQLNKNQVKPVPVQATVNIISKISDENQFAHASTTESNSEHVTTDLASTQVGHGLHADAVQVQEDDYHLDLPATSVEVLPVTQEREKVVSLSQSRKSRLQRIKPKPNLSQARPTLSKPGPLKDTLEQHVEETPNKSFESDFQPETSTTQAEAESSVGDTTGASSTHKFAVESCSIDEEKALAESIVLSPTTSERTRLLSEDLSNTPDNSHSDVKLSLISRKHLSSDCIEEWVSSDGIHISIWEVPDNESMPKDMFSKGIHNAESTSNETLLEVESSSKPNADQSSDPIAVSHVTIISTSTDNSSSLPLESVLSGKSTDDVSPVPTDSSIISDEALNANTLRLSPPKPRLEGSTRPLQVQQEQETTPAQTDSVVGLQGMDLVDPKPESDSRSDTQDPIALSGLPPATKHSLALMSAVSSAQVASTEGSAGRIQSCQGFSDFLPDQVPSDPDEPFFILSLTAIPSPTSTETANSEAGQVFDQPVTAALAQEHSVSKELMVPNKPSSLEKSDSKRDTYQTVSLVVADISQETPTTAGQSLKCPANEDGNEARVPSEKEKQPCTRRRAKPQTKPTAAQRKLMSKGSTEETAWASTGRRTRMDSKNAGPSEPKTPESQELRSGDVDLDQEIVTSEEDLNSNLGTKNTKPVRDQRHKRKPKDKPAPAKSPPPTKTLSEGSKAKAVRGKPPVSEPAASSSHDIRSTTQGKKTTVPSQTEADLDVTSDRTDQKQTLCAAEVSASQENVCVVDSSPDEEPITVSQYFFGDIFTEVENVSKELSVTGCTESVPNKPSSPEKSDSKSDTYQTVSLVVADISQETPTTAGQSLKCPANEDGNEARVPSEKEKQPCTRRRAKPQTKPTTAQRKLMSKGSTEETAWASTGRRTRMDSKNAGPSEPKTPESQELRSGDVDLDQENVTSEEDLNSNLGTKNTKPVRDQRHKRKPKDKPAPAKSPPPTKTLSEGSKAKAVRGKPPVSEPAASSSHDIRSTTQGKKTTVPSQTEADLDVTSDRTDQKQTLCAAEVSASQENVCVVDSSPDEEPITVSQSFFGDIFTEVENVSKELLVTGCNESVPNKPSYMEKSDSKSNTYQTVSLVVADISQETPTTAGQSLKCPANEDGNEARVPSEKEKQPCTRRRAKPQTKPTAAQRKLMSKGSTEETAWANTGRRTRMDSKNAGPSEPKTPESQELRSGDVDLDQENVTSEEDLNSNLGTKNTKPVRDQRHKRKPKDKPAPAKSPPPTKTLSEGSKAKAVRGKPPVSEPAASSSHDIRSTTQGKKTTVPSQTETDLDVTSDRTDQKQTLCAAEVSASQENVCVVDSSPDEEPITVSQSFFGDIFTEVEK